ncbi:PSD1 and planctomycete cytochrome C domain-containing protein [Verrucomicrobiota bacterium sgz303538]
MLPRVDNTHIPGVDGSVEHGRLFHMIEPLRYVSHELRAILIAWFCLLSPLLLRAANEVSFSRDVLPILSDNCFYCHGPDAGHRKADLRLDIEDEAKKARDGVVAIAPGKSEESELYLRLISKDADEVMPPPKAHKSLTSQQISQLKRWIDQGAPWGLHWAFSPLTKPTVPAITSVETQVRTPVDAFVVARLQTEGLQPSPQAGKAALFRRVSLDLTGLPSTPEEIDAFVADASSDAFEKVVDRLLASPAFGERLAWDWMEAARYADSNGYQGDSERTMWPWRDWVVKAFNENLPYDRFTVWQLAGDLLPDASFEQRLATGFCRNHAINGEGGRIPEENRVDYVMDMAETVGTVWMGLTVGCARCHDHKFDPISQRDYYSLFAFFNQTPVNGGGGDPQSAPNLEIVIEAQKAELEQLKVAMAEAANRIGTIELSIFPRSNGESAGDSGYATRLEDKLKAILEKSPSKRPSGEIEELRKHFEKDIPEYAGVLGEQRRAIDKYEGRRRAIPRVMVMQDMPESRKTFILEKGLYNKPGNEVVAATPARFPPMPEGTQRNRLGLAQWLVAKENPLMARVTVNRIWQMFFGTGLVKTAEDFGLQGEFPKHPELLDWLAAEFRDSGWDVKRLVRLIVTSSTYRQSSRVSRELAERDPDNRLLTRGPRFRMPSWMIRDQALAASGLMVNKQGGPPVNPYQPSGVWEEATFGTKRYTQDHGDALYRRSLYTFWRRIVGPTTFFDTQARSVCTVKPTRTNTPLHALTTLNDATFVEAARVLAERVMRQTAEPRERLNLAFRKVLAREATPDEQTVLLAGLARVRDKFSEHPEEARKLLAVGESKRDEQLDPLEHAAWSTTCLAILNLDEALTKE